MSRSAEKTRRNLFCRMRLRFDMFCRLWRVLQCRQIRQELALAVGNAFPCGLQLMGATVRQRRRCRNRNAAAPWQGWRRRSRS